MVKLTQVAVRLRKGQAPSKEMVRDIIGTFFAKEWPFVDTDTIKMTYNPNFTNAHCPVERPAATIGPSCEPLKAFIKFHASTTGSVINIFSDLVPLKHEEASLCEEFSQTGLGAKVYGFFQTQDGACGRIDEFLEARNMIPTDVEDTHIRASLAKSLATFQTMKFDFLRKAPVEQYYRAVTEGLEPHYRAERLRVLGKQAGVNIDSLIDYDFTTRLQTIVHKLESIKAKAAWCIHDIQNMNIMIGDSSDPKKSKVTLIDFEFVMHNYRAFDIGGHFMQKMFQWFDEESRIAPCRKYTDDEKRHFCDVYAATWNERTGDADTGQQILVEAEYGFMLAIIFDVCNMLSYMRECDEANELDLLGMSRLFKEFVDQYAKLGLEEP